MPVDSKGGNIAILNKYIIDATGVGESVLKLTLPDVSNANAMIHDHVNRTYRINSHY